MMKAFLVLVIAMASIVSFADESCKTKMGMKDFSIKVIDGGLESSDTDKFSLAYLENGETKNVADAKITVLKSLVFNEEDIAGHNGMGDRWINKVTDYAIRFKVETETTELYPRFMGNPAVKSMEISMICTSIKKL